MLALNPAFVAALALVAFVAYGLGRIDERARQIEAMVTVPDLPPNRPALLTMPEDWEWWQEAERRPHGPGSGSL